MALMYVYVYIYIYKQNAILYMYIYVVHIPIYIYVPKFVHCTCSYRNIYTCVGFQDDVHTTT